MKRPPVLQTGGLYFKKIVTIKLQIVDLTLNLAVREPKR